MSLNEKTRSIGVSAKNQCITNLKNTFSCFKRFIGRQFDDPLVQKELANYPKPFTVTASPSGGILLQVKSSIYNGNRRVLSLKKVYHIAHLLWLNNFSLP